MTTPYEFGKHVGKQAFVMLPGMIGAGLGAATAPTGRASGLDDMKIRAESTGRGAMKGTGAGLGMTAGYLLAQLLTRGKLRIPKGALTAAGRRAGKVNTSMFQYPRHVRPGAMLAAAVNQKGIPRAGGTLAGGVTGYAGADALLGDPSWEQGK